MEKVLTVLAAAAALGCAVPQGAWADSPLHSPPGNPAVAGGLPHPAESSRPISSEGVHRDRNDSRQYRLFRRERIFWYAGGSQSGPAAASYPLAVGPRTVCA
ncbi:MAG: hypothetical protein JO015_15825 [Verrucomicrobia bacterium]|nr:hypothetical protein [Verrucomicrobiota bacterium]